MPQSFTCLHYHIVFSTKHRQPVIIPAVRPKLFAYLGGLIRAEGGHPVAIGGMPDHVHILARLGQTKALADILRVVKANSSKWVHDTHPEVAGFGWQTGYGAFTVGQSSLEAVRRYVEGQEEHHRARSFQDEFRQMLRQHGIEWDERYIWD
ncbi:MAG: IS200/IS605 family transposase [Gemmataceae bacterium]